MDRRLRATRHGLVATIEYSTAGANAPLVHFAHATGMCAALYRPVLERLSPHVNVIASDARGHGRTQLAADPAAMTSWETYVSDLAALLATIPPPSRLILAGHSMGAAVSMELAAAMPASPAAVIMIEPAFVPFAAAATWQAGANPMADQALRRRAVWPSRAAVRAAYQGRGVFATWSDAALNAYLDDGLRDRADGTVELACAPAWEAATFTAVSRRLEGSVRNWRGGLTLLHGTKRSTVGAEDAAKIAARPGTVARRFDGADHFLPLAEPAAMSEAILAWV